MARRDRWTVCLVVVAVLGAGLASLRAPAPVGAQAVPGPGQPPSARCHVTDGAFTECPDGQREWSDIVPVPYPEHQAFLYQDQADLDPVRHIPGGVVDTRMLLYEDCTRTTPLGADEYFLISFDSVEKPENGPEELVRYVIHVFSDGTIVFIENGELETDESGQSRVTEIDHQRGRAGFVASPNCATPHLVVEYEILLDAAGGSGTSPGPSFWFAVGAPTPPPPPPPKTCPAAVGDSIDGRSAQWAAGLLSQVGNDVDKDGILHEVELSLGTDPCHYDTDGDGLVDSWEVFGRGSIGFDLDSDGFIDAKPELVFGTTDPPDPRHKDVYVEVDIYSCRVGGCPLFDPMVHEVDAVGLWEVTKMFADLPVKNPDGANGVRLHIAHDEDIPHTPNCDEPPVVGRTYFGTRDQRTMKPDILKAKTLAYRYLVSGHSTVFDDITPCSAPLPAIAAALASPSFPVPRFDNTPFGAANVGGRDMILSLSPLWICPIPKTAPYGLTFITVCDRGYGPGLFPTQVENHGFLTPLAKPYSRGLGRPDPDPVKSEGFGISQLAGRSVAHLLGHSLGLEDHADVANDPAKSVALGAGQDFWPPDLYPGATKMKLAESLYITTAAGAHLKFDETGTGKVPDIENTVFDNPILEFLATDRDGDGIIESVDNCTGTSNPGQEDLDGDLIGDPCDMDRDNDGVADAGDTLPADTDNDGVANASDLDDDNDAIPDTTDNCTVAANAGQGNVDGDGRGDACDDDADADGISRAMESLAGSIRSTPSAARSPLLWAARAPTASTTTPTGRSTVPTPAARTGTPTPSRTASTRAPTSPTSWATSTGTASATPATPTPTGMRSRTPWRSSSGRAHSTPPVARRRPKWPGRASMGSTTTWTLPSTGPTPAVPPASASTPSGPGTTPPPLPWPSTGRPTQWTSGFRPASSASRSARSSSTRTAT